MLGCLKPRGHILWGSQGSKGQIERFSQKTTTKMTMLKVKYTYQNRKWALFVSFPNNMYIFISLSIYTRVFVALVHIGRVHLSGVHFWLVHFLHFSQTPITDLWGQRLCLAQWENMHSTIFCHKSFVGSIKCRTFFNSAHRGLTCPMYVLCMSYVEYVCSDGIAS